MQLPYIEVALWRTCIQIWLAPHSKHDCDCICDQATLDSAEKQPIDIGFETRQAMQVVDFT